MAPRKSVSKPCHCGSADHEAMIKCNHCQHFIHYEYSGLSVLEISRALQDKQAPYICRKCAPTLSTDDRESYAAMCDSGSVFLANDSSQDPTPTTPAAQEDLSVPSLPPLALTQVQFNTMMKKATEIGMRKAMEVFEEMWEKREKKNNLVVVGFPEREVSEMEQDRSHLDAVKNVCKELDIPEDSVISTFGDGKKVSGRSRIMKVCFKERPVSARRLMLTRGTAILRELPNVSNLQRKPYIRIDMTFKERELDRKLQDDLRAKRNQEPGKQWIIRNFEIIERPQLRPRRMEN